MNRRRSPTARRGERTDAVDVSVGRFRLEGSGWKRGGSGARRCAGRMALGEQELGAAGDRFGRAGHSLDRLETERLGWRRRERARGRITAESAGMRLEAEPRRMGLVLFVGDQDRVRQNTDVCSVLGARGVMSARGVMNSVVKVRSCPRDRRVGDQRNEQRADRPNVSPGPRHREGWVARTIRTGQVRPPPEVCGGGRCHRGVGWRPARPARHSRRGSLIWGSSGSGR